MEITWFKRKKKKIVFLTWIGSFSSKFHESLCLQSSVPIFNLLFFLFLSSIFTNFFFLFLSSIFTNFHEENYRVERRIWFWVLRKEMRIVRVCECVFELRGRTQKKPLKILGFCVMNVNMWLCFNLGYIYGGNIRFSEI